MKNYWVASCAAAFLIAFGSINAFASSNCMNGAAAGALKQVISEVAANGQSFSNLKFQASPGPSEKSKTLKNGDVLEYYNVLIYVFDGTNVFDGIETPAKLSVDVVMRDVGAALCKVEKASPSEGDAVN